MTKEEFRALCEKKIVLLDGATGTNLVKMGMPKGVCPEKWICENQDIEKDLIRSYVESGSDIVYAPTFTANRIKLSEYGLYEEQKEIIRTLVSLSKVAACGKAYVAGDVSMTGLQVKPVGTLDFEELVDIYKEQIGLMADAGVDLIVVETMMSLQETRAAVIACKEVCDLPVMATLSFEKDGRTLFGTDAKTAAITLSALGIDAIGANCSSGPSQMISIIAAMRSVSCIPIIAKPNAGLPCIDAEGNTYYSMEPTDFAEASMELIRAGASIIGGCCGTNPEFILKLKSYVDLLFVEEVEKALSFDFPHDIEEAGGKFVHYLTSERSIHSFTTDSLLTVVGERINPTGKKKFQESLKSGSLSMAIDFAAEQEERGAKVLDVNLGMGEIDEKKMMLDLIDELSSVTNLPLSIDSSHIDVIEAALRRYPGRALINSIPLEKSKFEPLLKIAAKYGAMFILLPLTDDGLPKNFEEKIANIDKMVTFAEKIGFTKADFVVDPLVMTIGADQSAAESVLRTIAWCKELDIATICGLSNVSFGLPERSYVNSSFMGIAISRGLTMAIANPSQTLLMCSAKAADFIMNKEGAAENYLEYCEYVNSLPSENAEKEKTPKAVVTDNENLIPEELRPVYEAVLKGRKNDSESITEELIKKEIDPSYILNEGLMPAIDLVGEYFEKGKYFLPQLMSSAETMKNAISVLEKNMKGESEKPHGTVVFATVKGDIHDIGKNLVVMMLKNHGFNVIDLGKDVDRELIVDTAIKEKADIIALSALMTTTMKEMKEVILLAREKGCSSKVIVGGAVVTKDYADSIGADGYSDNAADCVNLVKNLIDRN